MKLLPFDSNDSGLTLLDLNAPKVTADYESSAPTGQPLPSMSDVQAWEQLLIGLRTQTGQVVTPEKAKRCATVLAIIRGLSEDTSALPLKVMKVGPDGDEEARNHPLWDILNVAPNDYMTAMEMREHMLIDLITWGGFYNLVNLDPLGEVESLWPLQAAYVTRRWREAVWTYTDPTTGISGVFDNSQIWRGTIMSDNGFDGVALTLLAREAIGLLLAAEQQGARLFAHGVQTDFALSTAETLDDDQKKQIRATLLARNGGSDNAFMPLLLESGLDVKKIGLTAVESQYIEARKYQTEDIARVFRYPEVLLGSSTSGKSSTYASAEQFFQSYTKHTLIPWAVRIEQTAHRDLMGQLERRRYYIKHDFSQLLRADEAGRIANWNAKINGGWAQPAEARKAEGMSYKPGLEYFNAQKANAAPMVGDVQNGNPKVAPTDDSGLAGRVAALIFKREHKALALKKESPDAFYGAFGQFVQDVTGAADVKVRDYLEMRRTTEDRFSAESRNAAIAALARLCR